MVRLRFFGCKDVCVKAASTINVNQQCRDKFKNLVDTDRIGHQQSSSTIGDQNCSSYHNNKLLSTLINHPRGSRKVSEGGGFRFESYLPYQKAHPSRMAVRRHPFPAPVSGVVPVVGGPNKAFS